MDIISIVKISVLCISIILIVPSCIGLYRWRKSAFDSAIAYLRNPRYFSPGEKVCIQVPDEPDMQYTRGAKYPYTVVYYEYCYTVEGISYCKSYFHEDNKAKLPSKTKIYYNRKNPKMMYREGKARDGVVVSVVLLLLGVFFLLAVVSSYIWIS